MSKSTFKEALEAHVKRLGSQKNAAADLGFPESYISEVRLERKQPSAKLVDKLGFKWAIVRK